ncbi:MAG: hypothetical protein HY317_04880 [Acidobacteria bacterium]|nr:hypothetical protein [Acidobacteriota bacterium]
MWVSAPLVMLFQGLAVSSLGADLHLGVAGGIGNVVTSTGHPYICSVDLAWTDPWGASSSGGCSVDTQ